MIDYFTLQTGSEHPAFLTVLYTLLFSFSLSMLIAITYYKTTLKKDISNYFIQSIILSALVASTVVQAIGDSIAIGLGVLGALAIIRFRTNFRNPRNIIFLFAALASGIATGVYGFTIAFVGITGFCIVAVVLNLSLFGVSDKSEIILRVVFEEIVTGDQITEILKQYCETFNLNVFREGQTGAQLQPIVEKKSDDIRLLYQYRLWMKDESEKEELISALKGLGKCEGVRLEEVVKAEMFDG